MAEPSIGRPAMPQSPFSAQRPPSGEREAVLPPTRKRNKVRRERDPSYRALLSLPLLFHLSPSLSLYLSLLVSLSEMVLRCPEVDGPPKPPPTEATAAGPSSSVPFGNPTLRWGRTRLMRCQINSDHGDHPDRRPSSSSSSSTSTSISTSTSTPPAPQTKNHPPASCSRPRLVLRIPLRNRVKKPETNEPSAPTKQRDHRQKDRGAAGGGAPVEIGAGSVTRSLRSTVGAEVEEKTPKKEEKTPKKAVFYMALSDQEIMNDFIAMTGSRPPRRPKRRPRPLQKKLDEMFPGSDLPMIVTPALYRVSDSSR